MHIQDSQWTTATGSDVVGPGRAAPLRVDAQRNLEHVLRAAREVFGELGYGAPMEDVARRARVGVGTVYRRFPSKDVLVRRIAEEETARLTEQARSALGQEDEAWSALARFLRTSVASGAGRLLPPQVLRVQSAADPVRVPQQRNPFAVNGSSPDGADSAAQDEAVTGADGLGPVIGGDDRAGNATGTEAAVIGATATVTAVTNGATATTAVGTATATVTATATTAAAADSASEQDGIRVLLDVVGQLVERAREAGELRGDVSVADVLLVIATAAPALPDPVQQAAASARLLDILLEGLRPRPGVGCA
ncbi:MAG TPA: helix-turn-helix domain-containing protein [Streptomyces sp.]